MQLADYTKPRGRQAELCRAIGAHASDFSNWVTLKDGKPKRPVPAAMCVAIERATGGCVMVEEMRPDLSWVRIKDKAWPHTKGRPALDMARAESSEAA